MIPTFMSALRLPKATVARPGAVRRTSWVAAAAVAAGALLGGCATSFTGQPVRALGPLPTSAPQISVPPTSVGTWYDLGHYVAPWLAGDAVVAVSGDLAPTRVAGLRRDDGRWLAIVLAQTAPAGSAPCPQPTSLHVDGGAAPVDGCLRLRRDSDFDRWLQSQHSVLYHWLEGRGWTARPRAWVSYRVPAGSRGAIETHALVDPALIEPVTRNNVDFLSGGEPGLAWARAFAAATRAAADGSLLDVPAFPFAPRVAFAPPAAVVAPLPPTPSATQVPPPVRAPIQAPRRDRE